MYAACKMASYSHIQPARCAGHDVDMVDSVRQVERSFAALRMTLWGKPCFDKLALRRMVRGYAVGEILRCAQDDTGAQDDSRSFLVASRAASSIAARMLDASAFPVPAMSKAVP